MLLPLVLIITGAWRSFAVAAVTTVALVGLSLLVYGVEPWQVYIAETMPFQWRFIEVMDGFYRFQMITPYTLFWFLGAPVGVALALQWAVAIVVAVSACAVVASEASWRLKSAIVALGSMLTAPYVLSYDLAIPLAALVWCLREDDLRFNAAGAAIIGAVWALPFGLGILIQTQGIPLLPVVLLVCYAWLVMQALGWRLSALSRALTARAKAPVSS